MVVQQRWLVSSMVMLALFLIACATRPSTSARAMPQDALLLAAVRRGNLVDIQRALHRGALVDATDNRGRTVLMTAVERGRLEIVKALLRRRPNAFVKSLD